MATASEEQELIQRASTIRSEEFDKFLGVVAGQEPHVSLAIYGQLEKNNNLTAEQKARVIATKKETVDQVSGMISQFGTAWDAIPVSTKQQISSLFNAVTKGTSAEITQREGKPLFTQQRLTSARAQREQSAPERRKEIAKSLWKSQPAEKKDVDTAFNNGIKNNRYIPFLWKKDNTGKYSYHTFSGQPLDNPPQELEPRADYYKGDSTCWGIGGRNCVLLDAILGSTEVEDSIMVFDSLVEDIGVQGNVVQEFMGLHPEDILNLMKKLGFKCDVRKQIGNYTYTMVEEVDKWAKRNVKFGSDAEVRAEKAEREVRAERERRSSGGPEQQTVEYSGRRRRGEGREGSSAFEQSQASFDGGAAPMAESRKDSTLFTLGILRHIINVSQILNPFNPPLKVGENGEYSINHPAGSKKECTKPDLAIPSYCGNIGSSQSGGGLYRSSASRLDAYNRLPTLANVQKFRRGQSGGALGDTFGMFPVPIGIRPKIEYKGTHEHVEKTWKGLQQKLTASNLRLEQADLEKINKHVEKLKEAEQELKSDIDKVYKFVNSGHLSSYAEENGQRIGLKEMENVKSLYDKINNRRYPICINAFLAIQKKLEECLEKNP